MIAIAFLATSKARSLYTSTPSPSSNLENSQDKSSTLSTGDRLQEEKKSNVSYQTDNNHRSSELIESSKVVKRLHYHKITLVTENS